MPKPKSIIIVIMAIAVLAAVAAAQTATATASAAAAASAMANSTCPPDIAIKWYALITYAAYASGQSPQALIAEAQAKGNVTVTISGVEVVIPYCSLNATTPSGARVAFMPAVGVGELRKLGLNTTAAKQVFERLKEARMEAMANLTKYLAPVEHMGFREAGLAVLNDSGYRAAAELNENASAALRALAEVLARAGANATLVEGLKAWASLHNETAHALLEIRAHGGVRGIEAAAAANVTAALSGKVGPSLALSMVNKSLALLNETLALLSEVNASQQAIAAVKLAMREHETAVAVLANLSAAGGPSGILSQLEQAVAANGAVSPALGELCSMNVSALVEGYAKSGLVNASAASEVAQRYRAFCGLAASAAEIRAEGGLGGMEAASAQYFLGAANGTMGLAEAQSRVAESLALLNRTLQLLRGVNASQEAIAAVESALRHHEEVLGVLAQLAASGGLGGIASNVEAAMEGRGQLMPNIAVLCANISSILAELQAKGLISPSAAAGVSAKYAALGALANLTARRGVMLPMVANFVKGHGGLLNILQNSALLNQLMQMLSSFGVSIGGFGVSASTGVSTTTSASGNVTITVSGGGVSISGGVSGSMSGSGGMGGMGK
nr:MAG: hypothetical protein TU35_05800 [Thermoproteus sp. AZ2]